jgi:hypothetical protein
MTALPNSVPDPASRTNPFLDPRHANHGDPVLAGGDVPITVWRLDDRDEDAMATGPEERLSTRLAQRLVLVYTRRGDAVVDFDGDPHLRSVTAVAGRSYVSITQFDQAAQLDALDAPVTLIVLRWPPRTGDRTPASITTLLAACQLTITAETCAIAVISSAAPGQPGATYAAHLSELLPAARAAGLTEVLQILAVTGPGHGDQFIYYATHDEAEAARQTRTPHSDGEHLHLDLMVFVSRDAVP